MSVRGPGLTDWYLQRVTTVFMSIYVLPMIMVAILFPEFTLADFKQLHDAWWMRALAGGAIIAYGIHAYIGLWVVCTDYIHGSCMRCSVIMFLRATLALTVLFVLYTLSIWS